MFSIFKRKFDQHPIDLSGIKTDMHSHLLPGIDDGAPDIVSSLQLKKGLEDLGCDQFITTPHIMADLYQNTPSTIDNAFQTLQNEGGKKNIRYAAEYFMDDQFDELLEKTEPLLTITGKKVLVEFSFVSPPINIKEKLFSLQIKGYQPILAHPERYQFFAAKKQVYDDFRDAGCLFQINILSLSGYYGKLPQELAHYLISKGYIDFLGTDLHHSNHLEALRRSQNVMPVIQQLLDNGLQNPTL